MKYKVITEVEAVYLDKDNLDCIAELTEMLQGVPHFYANDGLHFPLVNDGDNDEVIAYGHYVVLDTDKRILAIDKESFERQAEPIIEETH